MPSDALDYEPIGFDVRMGDLDRPVVIATEGSSAPVLVTVTRDDKQQLWAEFMSSRATTSQRVATWPGTTLGDLTTSHLSSRPERAFALPPGKLRTDTPAGRMALWAFGPMTVAGVALAMGLLLPWPNWRIFIAIAFGLVALVVLAILARRLPLGKHYYESNGQRHPLDELLDPRPGLRAAEAAVADVKQDYGRLLTDLCYRLDNPALFDAAEPATADFVELMIRWDNSHLSLEPSEVSDLAARLRVAFDAARANAEARGTTHVPEELRPEVDRAARIMRVATDKSAPAAERRAAARRAATILEGLALYYLPRGSQVEQLLHHKRPPALPGRWSQP